MKRLMIAILLLIILISACVPKTIQEPVETSSPQTTSEDTELPEDLSQFTTEQEILDSIIYAPILISGEQSLGGSFTYDDVQLAPLRSDSETYSLYTTRYFSFDDLLNNNIVSDWVECEVQQGEGVNVSITSCSWYPHTSNIEVGILNLTEPVAVCAILSGGDYHEELDFDDINAGTYIVYVRNVSSQTITDGSIRYSIS